MERVKDVDFTDKCLASFDVKSLFTNVSVEGALKAIQTVVANMDPDCLPLPKADYVKLVPMCMKCVCFFFV